MFNSFVLLFLQPAETGHANLLVPPVSDRLHTSASNPNLLIHHANDGKLDSPTSPHENRIQEIRLRETFVSSAESGMRWEFLCIFFFFTYYVLVGLMGIF
jgi:hypothetical protein